MGVALRIVSRGSGETRQIGECLGRQAQPGDVYLLSGNLGAGKTCLTQGIARGLGVEGYARSPSFVIATRYIGRLTLHHIDLYRIQDSLEASDLGLEENLAGDDLCVVEWADRAPELFPSDALWVQLEYGRRRDDRVLTFSESGSRYASHLKGLKERADQR